MYVALFPCNECAKIIIQSGLKEVIYYRWVNSQYTAQKSEGKLWFTIIYLFSDKHQHKPETIASKKMLDMAGIKYRQFTPKNGKITIDFSAIEN